MCASVECIFRHGRVIYLLFLVGLEVSSVYSNCSTEYGVATCTYTPAPPGQAPSCAKPGLTFCEELDQYPKDLIKDLVTKWRYDHDTLLLSESQEDFKAYFYPPPPSYETTTTQRPIYGPPQQTPFKPIGYNPSHYPVDSPQYPPLDAHSYSSSAGSYNPFLRGYHPPNKQFSRGSSTAINEGNPSLSKDGIKGFTGASPTGSWTGPVNSYSGGNYFAGGNIYKQPALNLEGVSHNYTGFHRFPPQNVNYRYTSNIQPGQGQYNPNQQAGQYNPNYQGRHYNPNLQGEGQYNPNLQRPGFANEGGSAFRRQFASSDVGNGDATYFPFRRTKRASSVISMLINEKPQNETTLKRQKRQSELTGEPLCQSRSTYIMPKAAINNKGNWMFIVNMPELNGKFTQLVKSETCRTQQCSGLCSLPNGYVSKCEQKYVQKRLVALQGNGNDLYTDLFWLPSCCVCTITNTNTNN